MQNKISGVYKITNKLTGDFYIGSSQDIKQRWARHKSPSKWALRPGMRLYQAFIKYGLDNFIFEVIEETVDLRSREQYWIDQLKPDYNNYNAKGHNEERWKETRKRASKTYRHTHFDECMARQKAWYEIHRDDELAKSKAYHQTHRDERSAKRKVYNNKLCLYEGETITLAALSTRFIRQGIPHARLEAKKYLV